MSSIGTALPLTEQKPYTPIEKPQTGRDVTINILIQLAQHDVGSSDQINKVAAKFNIDTPESIISSYLGEKILRQPGYNQNTIRSHILLDAISQAQDLPEDELLSLIELTSGLEIGPLDSRVIVERHLDSLHLTKEERDFWRHELCQYDCPRLFIRYLPLLRDSSLFALPATRSGSPRLPLLMAQISKAFPLMNPKEIKIALVNPHQKPWDVIELLATDSLARELLLPTLCPLEGMCDEATLLKAYEASFQFGEDRQLAELVTLWMLDGVFPYDSNVHYRLSTPLKSPKNLQLLAALSASPQLLTGNLICRLCKPKHFAGSTTLPTQLSPEMAQSLYESIILSGDPKHARTIAKALFQEGGYTHLALCQIQLLSTLSASQIEELAQMPAADIQSHLIQIAIEPMSPLSLEEKQYWLSHLADGAFESWMESQISQLRELPQEGGLNLFKLCIDQKLKPQLQDKILDLHFQQMGLSPDLAARWKSSLRENRAELSPWILSHLYLAAVQLRDPELWLSIDSGDDPLLTLAHRAMQLSDRERKPLLWPGSGQLFIGEGSSILTMYALSAQHPEFEALLQTTSPLFDSATYRHLTDKLGWKSRLIAAYTLAIKMQPNEHIEERGWIPYAWGHHLGITALSAQERVELLHHMIATPSELDQHVLPLLTSSERGYLPQEQAETLLLHALERSGMSKPLMERAVEAIMNVSEERSVLWSALAPYLASIKPEDVVDINQTGSSQALLVSLLLKVLEKEEGEIAAPPIADRLKIMEALPQDIRLQFQTALLSHPKASSAIFQNMARLIYIDFESEGLAKNSWEPYIRSQLKDLHLSLPSTALQSDLEEAWRNLSECRPSHKPASWLSDIEEEGWVPFKVLGRTHIYQRDGKYLALKWQKTQEPVADLFKEMATLQVLHKQKEKLDLISEYPTPIGVFQFDGDLPEDLFQSTPVAVQAKITDEKVAYVYQCDNDGYFIYLHDPKAGKSTELAAALPAAALPAAEPPVAEQYALARHAVIADLFTLAKNGLIMTQMADIFHRSEDSRSDRDDQGRYMAMNFLVRDLRNSVPKSAHLEGLGLGNGRLHHIERAVQYINAGYSGLRDVGDSALLSTLCRKESEFSTTYFSMLFKGRPEQAATSILANFLAEYLLVYELAITEKLVNTGDNALDWRDPQKVSDLATELQEGFQIAMSCYSGISSTLASRFLQNAGIDWNRAALQLHFWSRKDEKGYLPYNDIRHFPKEIYGSQTTVMPPSGNVNELWGAEGMSEAGEKDLFEMEKMKEIDLSRHRGTFNGVDPVKEGERARGLVITHLLLLDQARLKANQCRDQAEQIKGGNPEDIRGAIALLQRSLDFWPFDKATYALLEKAHTKLGHREEADSCREQRAALILQNAWHRHQQRLPPARLPPARLPPVQAHAASSSASFNSPSK